MLTQSQLDARKGKITSSIAAGALGLSSYMTPIQAWLAARGELGDITSKPIERGNMLEAAVLAYPCEVDPNLTMTGAEFRSHPDRPWAGDSADAVYYRGTDIEAIGEGKTVSQGAAAEYGDEDTDEIPNSTLVQSHWHLIHWPEVNRCLVPVLVGGYRFEFRLYIVDRNPELEGILLDDLAQWHRDYVVTGRMPPAQAGDVDYIRSKYPTASRPMTVATPEIRKLAESYREASEAIKQIEQNKGTAGARLRALLGDHEGCRADWGSVSYRNNKPKTVVDWQAIATELGATDDLIEKHTTTKPGARVLRVTIKD